MSDFSTEDLLLMESIVSKMQGGSIPSPQEVNNVVDTYYEEPETTPRLDLADEMNISLITPIRGKIQAYSAYGQAVSPKSVVEMLNGILQAAEDVVAKYNNLGLVEESDPEIEDDEDETSE